jgi:quercetin dioxygenase-like cupin family protein
MYVIFKHWKWWNKMDNNKEQLILLKKSDSIQVVKENKTEVNYFIFPEYEIHLNKIPPNSIQEWHFHSKIEEVILVTKGVLTCKWIEEEKEKEELIHQNELVQVKNSIHTFENRTKEEVEFTVFRLVLDGNNKRDLIKNDKTIVER